MLYVHTDMRHHPLDLEGLEGLEGLQLLNQLLEGLEDLQLLKVYLDFLEGLLDLRSEVALREALGELLEDAGRFVLPFGVAEEQAEAEQRLLGDDTGAPLTGLSAELGQQLVARVNGRVEQRDALEEARVRRLSRRRHDATE